MGPLHQRSTFKPEEGREAGYADLDPYSSPVQEVYHAYAEPLPVTGPAFSITYSLGLPMQETLVQSLGQEDPQEKEMATYSNILAWEIP